MIRKCSREAGAGARSSSSKDRVPIIMSSRTMHIFLSGWRFGVDPKSATAGRDAEEGAGLLVHVRYRTHLLVQAPPPPPAAMVVPDGRGWRAGGYWWDPETEKWSPLGSCACMQQKPCTILVHAPRPGGGRDRGRTRGQGAMNSAWTSASRLPCMHDTCRSRLLMCSIKLRW